MSIRPSRNGGNPWQAMEFPNLQPEQPFLARLWQLNQNALAAGLEAETLAQAQRHAPLVGLPADWWIADCGLRIADSVSTGLWLLFETLVHWHESHLAVQNYAGHSVLGIRRQSQRAARPP